jgi:hypothetical protein
LGDKFEFGLSAILRGSNYAAIAKMEQFEILDFGFWILDWLSSGVEIWILDFGLGLTQA